MILGRLFHGAPKHHCVWHCWHSPLVPSDEDVLERTCCHCGKRQARRQLFAPNPPPGHGLFYTGTEYEVVMTDWEDVP